MKQNENLSVALSAVKEVLERNGLDAFWKPAPPSKFVPTGPAPTTTFNMSSVKFHELSDDGLDLVDRVIRGLLANERRSRRGRRSHRPRCREEAHRDALRKRSVYRDSLVKPSVVIQ